jgi:hypothetical protein
MSRSARRGAVSLVFVLTVLVALVTAAVVVLCIVSPKISAVARAPRLTIVETASNTSTDISERPEEVINEVLLGEIVSELFSGPPTHIEKTEHLEVTISERAKNDDKTVSEAKRVHSNLRSQIELYRWQHHGVNPLSTLIDLTQCTNSRGVVGQEFPFGPYLSEIPENPITKSAAVRPITSDPPTTEDLTPGGGGWLYNAKTGNIWLDHPEFLAP